MNAHNIFAHALTLAGSLLMASCIANTMTDEAQRAASMASANASGNLPGGANVYVPPFEKTSITYAAKKIKRLLITSPLTQDEISKVSHDEGSLADLVDTWMASPSYKQTMLNFFADSFQQSQLTGSDPLSQNQRESFARTVWELTAQGAPFTDVFSTKSYMMTTGLMHAYALLDTSYQDDTGNRINQWYVDDPNWHFTVEKSRGPTTLEQISDPKSANYMTFYAPNLGQSFFTFSKPQTAADLQVIEKCKTIDPFVFYGKSMFAGISNGAGHVDALLKGGGFAFFYPEETAPGAILCSHLGIGPSSFQDGDYADWRMVTIRPATAANPQTKFTQLNSFRAGAKDLYLYSEHAGYLTTPSFMIQWPTNVSNSSRAIINQAMITGLGGAIGDDRLVTLAATPAVDLNHSKDAACYKCHQDLDPMRQFYRQSYTLFGGRQSDKKVIDVPATFAYAGVIAQGKGVTDLSRLIATHPMMPITWTVKVCTWASGVPCLESDPEIKRIASNFAANKFQFHKMVREVMLSPLVTYQAKTATVAAVGQASTLVRRHQLCGLLANVTGLGEVCGRDTYQGGSGYDIPSLAAQVPGDQYGRGVNTPLYITKPDAVVRSTIENLCTLLATKLSDAKSSLPMAQLDPGVAVPSFVHDLMGILPEEDAEPISILKQHWADVVAAKQPDNIAWQSTFTLACASPFVASSGQ